MHANAGYKQLVHLFVSALKVDLAFVVSKANQAEFDHFKVGNKTSLFFCECRLTNLFPTHFIGSGFGRSDRHSRWAACADLAMALQKTYILTDQMMTWAAENSLTYATKAERQCEWKKIGARFNAFRTLASAAEIPMDAKDLSEEQRQKLKEFLEVFKSRVEMSEQNAAAGKKRKLEEKTATAQNESAQGAASRSLDNSENIGAEEPPAKRVNVVESDHLADVSSVDGAAENGKEDCPVYEPEKDKKAEGMQRSNVEDDGAKPTEKNAPETPSASQQLAVSENRQVREQHTTNDVAEDMEVVKEVTGQGGGVEPTFLKKLDSVFERHAPEAVASSSFKPQRSHACSESEESFISIADEPEVIAFNSNLEKCMPGNVSMGAVGFARDRTLHGNIGVTTQAGFLPVYEKILAYRNRFPRQFKEFDEEIWTHYETNGQNDYTFAWKMRAREMIHHVIRESFPMSQLVVVGSTLNGCGSFNSDLDMCLCIKNPQGYYDDNRSNGVKILRRIWNIFKNLRPPFMKDIEFISKAKASVTCLCPLFYTFFRIDDRFGSLCLLIKHWAINNDIQDAMTGTFNSYSLILMVLHFLQTGCSPPVLPNLQFLFREQFTGEIPLEELSLFEDLPPWPRKAVNKQSIGELVIGFFEYYSNFDFDHIGISVHRGDIFHRNDLPESSERFKLYIEEPFDGQNTARCITKTENFNKILNAIMRARNAFLGDGAQAPRLRSIGV
ncbi:hypothetical protein QR680_004971 [Steinernema hermaphroditum]|uniref:PAP-associated domain-containing protein n=1 Tax=Steinernema hermaphroditum TaxID=289476 RepID=A0AA39HRU9_9BILA|nr:hypothetical protein QR680_004971 [Steinernema hermaphroditum]